ncbi:uncharacterized protein LOC131882551 [Tigriopus californicus]|uniref:uncharacterized protein LOC131882551 n=1 Tax=Tigriopus californicus TaxID=6832 RepID=UPI0027DA1F05|nr:uncharacterized protein LOC131882551 [Tigriopus californicus]|eukprot:TCALIF_08344-PA protein Name:"Protein of unknown function" AED:0.10 eAED:0.10 QI:38/1/1/1/0.66/0.75/4/78/217
MKTFIAVVSLMGVMVSQSGPGVMGMPQTSLPASTPGPSSLEQVNEEGSPDITKPLDPPPPLYFTAPASVNSAEKCKAMADGADKPALSYPPIFVTPENSNICIFSIADSWRYEEGFTGNCNGECCEYVTPNEEGKPSVPNQELSVKWTSISESENCQSGDKTEAKPQIMKGEFRDQVYICHNTRDNLDAFQKSLVELQICSNGCCIFAPPGALVPQE